MNETTATDRPSDWTSDKWSTPPELVDRIAEEFGTFDLDPCAESHTAKASRFYTIDDDGLTQPWHGRVFVNPPYSDIRPWCEKAREETDAGRATVVVCLLPSATDTRWFHESVLPYAEVRFLQGRVRFIGWRGTPIPAPRTPSLLAIYRSEDE